MNDNADTVNKGEVYVGCETSWGVPLTAGIALSWCHRAVSARSAVLSGPPEKAIATLPASSSRTLRLFILRMKWSTKRMIISFPQGKRAGLRSEAMNPVIL